MNVFYDYSPADNRPLWNKNIKYLCAKAKGVVPKILALCCNTYEYSNEARGIMFNGVSR